MPVLYHGTSWAVATTIAGNPAAGTIDVTRGRGEFGRGFYTQDSSGNAARRGQYLFGCHRDTARDGRRYHSNLAYRTHDRTRPGPASHQWSQRPGSQLLSWQPPNSYHDTAQASTSSLPNNTASLYSCRSRVVRPRRRGSRRWGRRA